MPNEATPMVSIVIVNYNYERFLREAIASALAVDWPRKEVIVVDDGSTDGSREVIEAFGPSVEKVFKSNGGQNSAASAGFERATGAWVLILDSDDVLEPDVLTATLGSQGDHLGEGWAARVSKIQWPLLKVLEDGATTHDLYPSFPGGYGPSDVRDGLKRSGWYISSPTSGNLWSRWFLDLVMPLPSQWSEDIPAKFFDGYLSTLAAYMGEVVTVASPLGRYRINTGNMWTQHFSVDLIVANSQEDHARAAYVTRKLQELGQPRTTAMLNYLDMMKVVVVRRFAADRLRGEASHFTVARRAFESVARDPALGIKSKVVVIVWIAGVMLAPKSVAMLLVKLRFVPSYRPPLLLSALRLLSKRNGR